jgi:hypothetical protein
MRREWSEQRETTSNEKSLWAVKKAIFLAHDWSSNPIRKGIRTRNRRHGAIFIAASARADFFAEKAETLSRSHGHTPLRAPTPTTLSSVSRVRSGRLIKTINRP